MIGGEIEEGFGDDFYVFEGGAVVGGADEGFPAPQYVDGGATVFVVVIEPVGVRAPMRFQVFEQDSPPTAVGPGEA